MEEKARNREPRRPDAASRARGRGRAPAPTRGKSPDAAQRRLAAAGLSALLALALATAASAHHGEAPTGENEVGTLGTQNTGGTLSTDTELTPVGKDGAAAGWQQIGGSLWRPDGTITDMATPGPGLESPTPYDLDFYGLGFLKVDVAMTNGLSQEAAGIEAKTNGFAVGAQCRRSDLAQPVPAEAVPGCERVPVIYRYYEHPTKGLIWEESWRASDKDDPGGFVATVAWLTPDRALAVGGTGTYPRREQELSPEQIRDCQGDADAAQEMAVDESAGDAPGAAVEAAAEVTKNPPDSITGTVTVDVGPHKPFFSPDTVGQWPTSVKFKAGAFEATLNTRMGAATPAGLLGGHSASTPLGTASFDSNGSLSISAANGALEAGGGVQNPATRTVRRPAYERALADCVARARVQNDIESGAGMARAWLYTEDPETKVGSWRELRNKPDPKGNFTGEDEDEIPDAMRALHAVDASPRPKDCGAQYTQECAIAGGMRQLWHFADGEFTRGYGPELGTPPGEGIVKGSTGSAFGGVNSSASNFRFRVRDIRFAPNWGVVDNQPVPRSGNPLSIYAAAVTSGCCAEDRSGDRPASLSLGDSGWSAALGPELGTTSQSDVLGDSGSFNPDSYYALTVLRRGVGGADSLNADSLNGSTLRTPGGPSERYSPREPPSRFTAGCDNELCTINFTIHPGGGSGPAPGTTLSSLRLLSADGNSRGFSIGSGASSVPSGIPNWAVGVLRSSGRGVAYHTAFGANRLLVPSSNFLVPLGAPNYLAKPDQCTGDEKLVPDDADAAGVCSAEAYQRKNPSKALYALPSYALNAFRVAGEDPVVGAEGTGWAVGDHGAIATRGGGVATAEAPPARRGAKSTSQPLSREAFDRHREAVTSEPGSVPALIPGTLPAEPGFYDGQGGSAEQIVMSRDGSEGWAFGDSEIYRYDGVRWAPCDARGVGKLVPPDPACKVLDGVTVSALARIPLERDADPTNDDELEAVALTGSGFYRYREGRWSLDKKLSQGLPPGGWSIAFLAPDEVWAVAPVRAGSAGASTEINVRHFNGESWVQCTRIGNESTPEECDDDARRLRVRGLCQGGSASLAVAGERIYLYTTRDLGPRAPAGGQALPCAGAEPDPYPVILYRDTDRPCEELGDPGCWQGGTDPDLSDGYNPTDGGWDPGCVRKEQAAPGSGQSGEVCAGTDNTADQGQIASLSVAQDADGSFEGWALGSFGGLDKEAPALMMRLSDGRDVPGATGAVTEAFRPWAVRDAADDYLRYPQTSVAQRQQLTLPAESGRRSAFMFLSGLIGTRLQGAKAQGRTPALAFDPERRRWTAIPTPWRVTPGAEVKAIAPDGRGGFWAAGHGLHHYTDRAPRPVFSAAANPAGAAGRRVTALGAGADGTLWLGDDAGGVYRYDRIAGWSSRVEIPGWEPARATARAPVSAIALGPGGEGVAVGPGGRIANLGERVGLDPAATIGCDPQAPEPPCGTGRDLLAAGLAPDGSAILAGHDRALLWRPAGGEFRPLAAPPPVPLATSIVEVEMPRPDRAYLLTATGSGNSPASRVIRGDMPSPGVWRWQIEVGDSGGTPDPLTASDGFPGHAAIRDIALDASGRGYAVGDAGLVLERIGDGESPWRRVPIAGRESFQSVALPEGGGEGALIGGGSILTLVGERFEVARHADPNDPIPGTVSDLALAPGYAGGEVEAWALKGPFSPRQALLHHPVQPADSRLDPSRGLGALTDAPAPRAGELAFAALGKQDCEVNAFASRQGNDAACGPPDGANRVTADLVNRRVREELASRADGEARPRFALFTGDAVDAPGGRETFSTAPLLGQYARTPLDANLKHRRWVELVADPLTEQGLPMFGAIGGLDVARDAESCTTSPTLVNSLGNCPQRRLDELRDQLGAQGGLSLPWRATMAAMPAPWQREQEAGGLRFERVGAGALSQRAPGQGTPEARASAPANVISVRGEGYPLDEGDTHYAVDAIDEETDEKVARIVVVDTSMRSIAASDPQQHPIEAGGQLRWLEEVLCFEGSAEDTDGDVRDCTREEGQQAIVLSNTPTYSYGPISPDETQADAAAFEAVLLKNQVNVVVSGRLGWQGRYWTLAPGVHAPCPGQAYRPDSNPPSLLDAEICGANAVGGTSAVPDPNQAIQELPEDAKRTAGLAGQGAIPFVVSSTAGGTFNARASRGGFATAAQGFWRGYSVVRLHPSGDPAKTIVEQRPILDWVGLSANDPSVAPGQRLQLQSFAREAFGMDTAPRYYEIPETQAITHRWHLLAADPKQPWVAKQSAEGPCAPYACLPENIGTIDPDTGEVRAGNGKYPDTFGLATLSVGEHVAVQPLVFTKSASFVLSAFGLPPEVPAPGASLANAPSAPAPPSAPKPPIPQVNAPEPPLPPAVPPIAATQPPEPQPPAPPAPPPPTEQPSPLSLTLAPPGITVATPTAVIQPPTPPVNPAPPGGARREARQRQAATQKSGADSDGEQLEGLGGDLAQERHGPEGSPMTRRDRTKAEPSFTALARAEQPSAWTQGLLYGGGLTLMAAALALAFNGVRPTPRRRTPTVPAPASAQARRRT